MELQTNPVFEEDMQRLCALPVMEELRGRTVLVTGATGLIGQTLVSALLRYGDDDPGRQIRVIVLVNILTNVILNLAVFALRLYVYYKTVNILIFVFEVIIVFAEAVLYRRFLDNTRHPLLFSLAANAASFAAGCLVSLII